MSYVLADAGGYIRDFASGGGLDRLMVWAGRQDSTIRGFFTRGYTETPATLAEALSRTNPTDAIVKPMVTELVATARAAKGTLVISDGTANPDFRTLYSDDQPRDDKGRFSKADAGKATKHLEKPGSRGVAFKSDTGHEAVINKVGKKKFQVITRRPSGWLGHTIGSPYANAVEAVQNALDHLHEQGGNVSMRTAQLRVNYSDDQPRDENGRFSGGSGTASFHGVMTGFGDPVALFNVNAPGTEHHGSTVTGDTLEKLGIDVPPVPAEHGVFDAHGRYVAPPQSEPKPRPSGPWDKNARNAQLRTAVPQDPIGFTFNKANSRAIDAVQQQGADLVKGVSATTRQDIRDVVEEAFADQEMTVQDIADEIEKIVADPARAEVIARTETMRASNYGQQEAWNQAIDDGLLTGKEKKEWIATPDDRECDDCDDVDGQQVPIDGEFDTSEGSLDGPPLHPNCRCTVGLV